MAAAALTAPAAGHGAAAPARNAARLVQARPPPLASPKGKLPPSRARPGRSRAQAVEYVEPVFRPPAEWKSLVLQVTNGCSWNNCSFCEMYTSPGKEYSAKPMDQLEEEVAAIAASGYDARRVFLADGDAMTLPTGRLLQILDLLHAHFPDLSRVSSYCLPRNVKGKSEEDLRSLRDKGLGLVYIGCESGDDEVLERVNKGETYESSRDALVKLGAAGMRRSVMILNGLGGPQLSAQHAANSARLMNEAQPELLSTLTVSFSLGMERFQEGFRDLEGGGFRELSTGEVLVELEGLLSGMDLQRTIFRSDHASNYLPLQGVLGRDRERMLAEVRMAIERPEEANLRPEWARGL